jgi:penicillin-insensitive murein endopeptidase
MIFMENDRPSVSVGTPEKGKLINGKRLPTRGGNFKAYSFLGAALGRSATHHRVRDLILDNYRIVQMEFSGTYFVYGEIGWPKGGPFYPHRTHQNGLAVDFMVPVLNRDGKSVPIPTSIFNRFGYGLEFDRKGKSGDLTIDFDAMAAHLFYLLQKCPQYGIRIDRILFDPHLQSHLLDAPYGKKIKGRIRFNQRPAWVRHDDHYHVIFSISDKHLTTP